MNFVQIGDMKREMSEIFEIVPSPVSQIISNESEKRLRVRLLLVDSHSYDNSIK